MISENRFNSSATKAVVTVALTLAFLAVTFLIFAFAEEPCITCRANVAYAARYSAIAEYYATATARAMDFGFLDHELMYAGGYGLRPAAAAARGADFDFLDHELTSAGGYGLRPIATVERGADFDFLDHELMFAGDYALCATATTGGACASR